jgi:hypothetical protein
MFLTLTHASLNHLTPIYPPNNNRGQKYQSLGYEEDESEVWRYFEAERWRKDKGAWWVYYALSVFVSVRISALHRLSLHTQVWLHRGVAAAPASIVGRCKAYDSLAAVCLLTGMPYGCGTGSGSGGGGRASVGSSWA